MTLEDKVMEALKEAMRAKDQAALRTLRSIKAAILIFKTSGSGEVLDTTAEIRILQKMVKQRKESAGIFHQQSRKDLAAIEEEEITILEHFLPAQLGAEELQKVLQDIIASTGASSAKDMGKVIAAANQQLAGRAEGKAIAEMVKQLLQS